MARAPRVAGLVVAVFAAVGLALGLVGYLTLSWAQARFVAGAGGGANEFGPVFVGLVSFQTAATQMALAPVLSALLGTLAGSRFADVTRAVAVTGGSAAAGCLVMTVLAVAVTGLAGAAQGVGLGNALVPVVVTTAVGGGVGAAAGGVGATLVR
jgi:hypothetical protein